MITRIGLQDFKSHKHTALQPAPGANLIYGTNGSGKSSIKDAIEFALTGSCEGTDASGRGSDILRMTGHDTAGVRVTVGDLDITRTIESDGKVTLEIAGKSGDKTTLQKLIYRGLGTTEEALHALINSTRILTLPPAEQKAILMKAAGIKIPSVAFSPEAVAIITQDEDDQEQGGPIANRMFRQEEVEKGHKRAFNRRTDVNRKIKGIQVPAALEGDPPKATAEVIQARIRDLEKELFAIDTPPTENAAEILQENIDAMEGDRTLAEDTRDKAQAVLDESYKDATLDSMDKYVAAAKSGLAKATNAARDSVQSIRDAADEVARLTEISEATKGGTFECPVMKIACPLPKDELTKAKKKNTADLKKAQTAHEKLLGADNTANDGYDTAVLNSESAGNARSEWLALVEEVGTKTEHIKDLYDQIVEARERIAGIPPVPDHDPETITAIEGRIAKGREVHKHAIEWEARERTRNELQTELDSLQGEAEGLNLAIEELGPKGVLAAALAKEGGGLVDQANKYLAHAGIRIEIQQDPWKILVEGHLPVEIMSTSEKLRIGAALQVALALALGHDWVFIDNGDMLDAKGRSWLMRFLGNTDIQALVAFTAEDTYTPPESLTGNAYHATRRPSEPTNIKEIRK